MFDLDNDVKQVRFCKGCRYSYHENGVLVDKDGSVHISCNNHVGMFFGIRMNAKTGLCSSASVSDAPKED